MCIVPSHNVHKYYLLVLSRQPNGYLHLFSDPAENKRESVRITGIGKVQKIVQLQRTKLYPSPPGGGFITARIPDVMFVVHTALRGIIWTFVLLLGHALFSNEYLCSAIGLLCTKAIVISWARFDSNLQRFVQSCDNFHACV